jgi:hypothetical protein
MASYVCLKHTAQDEYGLKIREFLVLNCVANPTKNFVLGLMLDWHKLCIQELWKTYMTSECHCWDRVTLPMGGSWASGLGDIANMEDLADWPEDRD